MPEGMTFEEMTNLGFHNVHHEEPEVGRHEVMCKAGHIHVVEYKGGYIWGDYRCGWEFGWWRELKR